MSIPEPTALLASLRASGATSLALSLESAWRDYYRTIVIIHPSGDLSDPSWADARAFDSRNFGLNCRGEFGVMPGRVAHGGRMLSTLVDAVIWPRTEFPWYPAESKRDPVAIGTWVKKTVVGTAYVLQPDGSHAWVENHQMVVYDLLGHWENHAPKCSSIHNSGSPQFTFASIEASLLAAISAAQTFLGGLS